MQQLVSSTVNNSREITAYSKVAARPQHCYRCGVIQQLFEAHIGERLHQHISTHDVKTLAKALPCFNGRTIRSIAIGRPESRSTSTHPPLPSTTYSRGRRVQPDSRHQTGYHNHGAGTVHLDSRQQPGSLDSRQQPGSRGSAATPTSTPPLLVYEWGSYYSYNSSGTTSRGQETRRQVAWDFYRGNVRCHQITRGSAPSPVRSCCIRT